jgi:hypothetical protein
MLRGIRSVLCEGRTPCPSIVAACRMLDLNDFCSVGHSKNVSTISLGKDAVQSVQGHGSAIQDQVGIIWPTLNLQVSACNKAMRPPISVVALLLHGIFTYSSQDSGHV